MTPTVPRAPQNEPDQRGQTRDRTPTPHRRRDDIAIAQGFTSYWAKRKWLAEHPEAEATYDGRKNRPKKPRQRKRNRETPPPPERSGVRAA